METGSRNILHKSAPESAHIPSASYSFAVNYRTATLGSKSRGTATTIQLENPKTVSQRNQYRATSCDTRANQTRASNRHSLVADHRREHNGRMRSRLPKADAGAGAYFTRGSDRDLTTAEHCSVVYQHIIGIIAQLKTVSYSL